jgi:hypothetical protein
MSVSSRLSTDQYGVYWKITDGPKEAYVPPNLDLQSDDGDGESESERATAEVDGRGGGSDRRFWLRYLNVSRSL